MLAADWLASDFDMMSMVRPQTSWLVRWYLTSQCSHFLEESVTWRLHLAIIQSFQHRAARAKKHAFLRYS